MREKIKIDPKLKQEWESKLSELGLGEDIADPNEVSLKEIKALEAEHLISKELLRRFSLLPKKLRKGILIDIKNQHLAEVPFDKICERVSALIDKNEELAEMDKGDSDISYHAVNLEEDKLIKEGEEIVGNTDEFIERLEELAGGKNERQEEVETIN